MEPNFNPNLEESNVDKPMPLRVSNEPYYKEPIKKINLRKTGFTSYFWVVFALFWTIVILGGGGYLGYYAYTNHWNLDGIITVNNQYIIPERNVTIINNNNNDIKIDPKPAQVNQTINIVNRINSSG